MSPRLFTLATLALLTGTATADDVAPPTPDAPVTTPDAAPTARPLTFRSSRLFTMPTADVVGAYVVSLSGDGSLLQQPGVLTSAGVFAIGFGDLAQLEYRHTSAIGIGGVNAPVPAVGIQFKLPLPEGDNIPGVGLAARLGVPRIENAGSTRITETVSDLYVVGKLRTSIAPWLTLHGGVRISSAKLLLEPHGLALAGPQLDPRTMYLVTGGWEVAMGPRSMLVGEAALAPQFRVDDNATARANAQITYGLLGRLGLRWQVQRWLILDSSLGYQVESGTSALAAGPRAVVQWDIRLGAEVFVSWGALACRALGAFCE
jgi:hypothetical protein